MYIYYIMEYNDRLELQRKKNEEIKLKLTEISEMNQTNIDKIIENKRRNITIQNYYDKYYENQNNFMIQAIVLYGILIILSALIFGKIIPYYIAGPFALLYGTISTLYLIGKYIDIKLRSKRHFDKYELQPPANLKPIGKNDEQIGGECLGQECCPEGTTYSDIDNICIIKN